MEQSIKEDLYRYEGERCHSLKVQLRYFLFTPGFRYTYFFRKASRARNPFFRLCWHFLMRCQMLRTGIQIPLGTQIGRGFKIGHWGTIVINPAARIGHNFNISQGCLIGNAQGRRKGVPVIGNNVQMGANSLIIGGGKYRR